jgi:hypothetical protein
MTKGSKFIGFQSHTHSPDGFNLMTISAAAHFQLVIGRISCSFLPTVKIMKPSFCGSGYRQPLLIARAHGLRQNNYQKMNTTWRRW